MKVWLYSALFLAGCADSANSSENATGRQNRQAGSYETCLDMSGGVTSEMRNCSAQEYAAQDGRLNSNYRRLMSALPRESAKSYREAQRAWIEFRDKQCDAEAEIEQPGTLALLIHDSCQIELTAERADWLISEVRKWEDAL